MTDERLNEAYAYCDSLARELDRDRWIAALFAPVSLRRHLHALIAFAGEIRRIRIVAKDPLAGEMRLVWWLEAIDGERAEEAQANPVAAALLATIVERNLRKDRFEAWLLAGRDDLYEKLSDDEARGRALLAPLYDLSARALGGEAELAAIAAGEAEALAAGNNPEAALARIASAEARLSQAEGDVAPAFATLGAMGLDARRAMRGKASAAAWRRQIAIWLWGRRR